MRKSLLYSVKAQPLSFINVFPCVDISGIHLVLFREAFSQANQLVCPSIDLKRSSEAAVWLQRQPQSLGVQGKRGAGVVCHWLPLCSNPSLP